MRGKRHLDPLKTARTGLVGSLDGVFSRAFLSNSDYLLENGAAIKANNIATLSHKLTAVLRDPERLVQLKANARRLARPRGAFDVVDKALKFLPAAAR